MFIVTLITFFLVFGTGADTYALSQEPSRVILFKRWVTTVPFEENDGTVRQRAAHSYRIPCLVDVDGVMVAIADARYVSSNDNSFIETVAKYSVDDGKTWETQVAIKNSRVSHVSRIVDPTVLVRKNKIYILVGRYNRSTNYWMWHSDGSDWEPLLVVGKVTKSTVGGKTTANITWKKPRSLNYLRHENIAGSPVKQFLGGVSGAVVTKNGTFFIPVQVYNMLGKVYSTMIRSDDKGDSWRFAGGLAGPGYSEPAVVEWKGKLIMSVRYDYNFRKFYESTDMGASWKEAVGTLSRVWGTSPYRNQPGSQSSLISVTIEGKRVMLFTHPLNTKGKWLRDRLHLWMTDGNRIYDVGQISFGDENSAYSSLLYKNDQLFCMHEININEVYSLIFRELIGELEEIKRVIKIWRYVDMEIKKHNISTDGLVGFLSGDAKNDIWEDEFLCVNATVRNNKDERNKIVFKENILLAQWPISEQGQNQRYYFTNKAFTLVASVIIHKKPDSEDSLFGVDLNKYETRNFGLWCTNDRKWALSYGNEQRVLSEESWEEGKIYSVALIMNGRHGSVYINGSLMENSEKHIVGVTENPGNSYFYFFTSNKTADEQVTVSNILLYNRILNKDELNELQRVKDVKLNSTVKQSILNWVSGLPASESLKFLESPTHEITPENDDTEESPSYEEDFEELPSYEEVPEESPSHEEDIEELPSHEEDFDESPSHEEDMSSNNDDALKNVSSVNGSSLNDTQIIMSKDGANISLFFKQNGIDGSVRKSVFSLLFVFPGLLWATSICLLGRT